jgi:pimeloyl-ACP methyl ester carboxylesterase
MAEGNSRRHGPRGPTGARAVLAMLLASALASGCGGHESKAHSAATANTVRTAPVIVGPGELVAIGGGRKLFLDCMGSGSPTVVLEAGFGGDSYNWQAVQPQLGRTTRTCAYDRAGLGNSVARPGVHDARDELDDLQRLLDAAHLDPPYVLVGHSYGGLLARLFAVAHPKETAGVVLVDAMGRDQTRRELAIWPTSQERALRRMVARPVRDGVDLAAGEALAARVRSLGDTPLAVVTAGRHDDEWGHAPARLARALDRQWATMQDELAALSSDHVHVVARRSDHSVQAKKGQPRVVVGVVRAVVRADRDGTRLPACARLFSGPDIRCRS